VKGLDRRYRRVTWWLLGGMVIVVVACALGYALLQGQRWDATRDGCERTNTEAEANIGLLRDLMVRERVVLIAMARYPHVPPLAHRNHGRIVVGASPGYSGPRTCDGFADDRVGWPRL
jgi:hypothetical protein